MGYEVIYGDQCIAFGQAGSKLPVRTRSHSSEVIWITWGKPRHENHLHFLDGACVQLNQLQTPAWARLRPRPILLPIRSFKLTSSSDRSAYWVQVPEGWLVRGALVSDGKAQRSYIVTESVTNWRSKLARWWSKLVRAPEVRAGPYTVYPEYKIAGWSD